MPPKIYYQLLPICGVVQTVPTGMRQLDRGFVGAGFPHSGVECLIAQLNKLLMHYGCKSGLGIKLQASMELFIIELGLSHQPFLLNYSLYGHLVTDCWLKTIWEKTKKLNIKITVGNVSLPFPKQGDKWLLAELIRVGYSGNKLARLNRVRICMQVNFFQRYYVQRVRHWT